ncbi:MAG: AAC(3) family N-acetyltransferase [Anaerolineae bacterium]|nr:AAC(3) family N-acetyltransferase [Anaerolineae bacterium]
MHKVTRQQVIETLTAVGVQPGDGLLIHSALQMLGLPEGGPRMYLDAIQSVIGSEGTLVVPAFNFAFARGEDYDPAKAPAEGMGVFSEFVRQQPDALRTPHPMQSLAVIGKYAADLAGRDTPAAFDEGSAFARMIELDFKMLLLGTDIQAVSIFHYCEQRVNAPYRYWKDFSGRVRVGQDWQTRTYRMFVRDMDIDARLVITPIQQALQANGQMVSEFLNYGWVSLCRLVDFAAVATQFLRADPWVFVTNSPESSINPSRASG